MYNVLKNKFYTYFFNNLTKFSYTSISKVDDKEEVYYKGNKLVVVVKDEEIGQRIYELVKNFKQNNITIYTTPIISFQIINYIVNKQNSITMFWANVEMMCNWSELSEIERCEQLLAFVDGMEENGYVINASEFKCEKCTYISEFLSLFTLKEDSTDSSKAWFIEYIHYVFSNGGQLKDFYERIVTNNLIYKFSDFPYALPIIGMCYNYFVAGVIPTNIYKVLEKAKKEDINRKDEYLIANKNIIESNFALVEDNQYYEVYDKNVKLYHYISDDFRNFLIGEDEFLKNIMDKNIVEQIKQKIFDFDGNLIGYTYEIQKIKSPCKVLEKEFKDEVEILKFIFELIKYLVNEPPKTSTFELIKSDNDENCNFNIKQSLITSSASVNEFKIVDSQEFFNFINTSVDELKRQITDIFFKVYSTYLNKIYGKMKCSKTQLLEKAEIRYLSPILAEELIKYVLGKEVDYYKAIDALFKFISNMIFSFKSGYYYDSRFIFDPGYVPFIFNYEAEKKYGVKITKGDNIKLNDGTTIITFKKGKDISDIKVKEDSIRQDISSKIGEIEDSRVKIITISEIIYSPSINKDGMYTVAGYIVKTCNNWKLLTDETLLSLSNKDLLNVAGYLFCKFSENYISFDSIWMDDDFCFYIDIMNEKFQINRSNCSIPEFVNYVFDYLIKKLGYNPYAFDDFKLYDVSYSSYNYSTVLLKKAYSLDAYCKEHKMYYDSSYGICPVCSKIKVFVPEYFEQSESRVILEDCYAKHYKNYMVTYNLKLYKPSSIDMVEMEKNIDMIMNDRLKSKSLNFFQDCFIPYKKAVNKNNEFIGYIYEAVQFEDGRSNSDLCIDLKNETLSNLPRIKSLIRLIQQVQQIISLDLGFMMNPFSHVYLDKAHKQQVQILNIDFLCKGNTKNTAKWTYDYVCKVISSDDSIDITLPILNKNLVNLLAILKSSADEMTNYCPTHRIYYSKNIPFCPKCIDKHLMKNLPIMYVDKSKITSQKQLGEGGESVIYYYDTDLVAKVFKGEVINYNFKSTVMLRVLKKNNILEEINSQNLKYKYIVIKKILIDNTSGKMFAYIMDRVVDGKPLSVLKDKEEVKSLKFTRKDILEILITVGQGLETLHTKANIYIGDLNSRNILFDSQKNVYFLEFDGVGVDDIAPMFYTDGYIDPASIDNITMKDDWYSFAIQAFYYLTFTHPFNGIFSIYENGREVMLDIPSKMERKISLLGNHGMKPPSVATSWDWMDNQLKKAFLDIFEGDSRESIVPYLIKQYEELYSHVVRVIRISPKFIATQIRMFENATNIFNNYSALYKKGDDYYIKIQVNIDNEMFDKEIQLLPCLANAKDVLMLEKQKVAIVISEGHVCAINLQSGRYFYNEVVSNAKHFVVNNNSLYFTGVCDGENVIFERDFMPDDVVERHKIKFLTDADKQIKAFLVKFNSKFVIIKSVVQHGHEVDEVYCNSEKLYNISYRLNAKYNIVYDEATKSWLIVSSYGNGIILKASGKYTEFCTTLIQECQECINEKNIENISFNKSIIYVPSQDFLYIINVKDDQFIVKKLECNGIMTPNSRLFNINNDGFSVITDNAVYEIRRG